MLSVPDTPGPHHPLWEVGPLAALQAGHGGMGVHQAAPSHQAACGGAALRRQDQGTEPVGCCCLGRRSARQLSWSRGCCGAQGGVRSVC